jgi:hypothetical protein
MKRNRPKRSPEWSTLQQKWTSRTRTVKWLHEKSHRTATLHRRIDLINMYERESEQINLNKKYFRNLLNQSILYFRIP